MHHHELLGIQGSHEALLGIRIHYIEVVRAPENYHELLWITRNYKGFLGALYVERGVASSLRRAGDAAIVGHACSHIRAVRASRLRAVSGGPPIESRRVFEQRCCEPTAQLFEDTSRKANGSQQSIDADLASL